jgi:hypothetical protein
MTVTASLTKKEADLRKLPDEGKLKPYCHIVRIVVTRRPSDQAAAGESGGPGQSHGLTKEQLRAAETELKEKDAPPSSGGTSTGQESSAKMFDVLEPTDIVVVGREPASVRTVDSEGRKKRQLDAHSHHHTDTVLRVWTDSDTIEYQCDLPFQINEVKRAGWNIYDAPPNPFAGQPPYKATQRATDGLWVWRSSVVPAKANNQQYKMTFTIFDERGENGEDVDPDVICGNPPPTP